MNRSLTAFAIVFFGVVLSMIGCTSNQPFRTNFESAGGDPARAVIESTSDYKLGFVEFDDQGSLWCTRQEPAVEQMIRDEAGIGSATPQGIFLVAFGHGWEG